jgi:hypothetical protein
MINTKLWIKRFEYNIDTKYLILLILATLHHEVKITDEKLKGQLQALRKGTLLKKKNTYHCEINERWYDNELPIDIFKEIAEDKGIKEIPFKKFITYIQLFENVNYNYALNIFGSNYLYRIFNSWNPEYCDADFCNYMGFYIPNIYVTNDSHTCYECGHEHSHYGKNERANLLVLNEWIHKQKKGNLSLIPRIKIESYSGWPF